MTNRTDEKLPYVIRHNIAFAIWRGTDIVLDAVIENDKVRYEIILHKNLSETIHTLVEALAKYNKLLSKGG